MKNPRITTEVVHSNSKPAWNIVGTQLGGKYKIARVPYVPSELKDVTEREKEEARQHAQFISHCFNNSDSICAITKPNTYMKTQIELAEEYANFNYHPASEFRSHAVAGFHKGYETASPKWIPFNDETGKYLDTLDNPLLLFDNGETCRYDEPHPFAIMTHFLPIPPTP